MLAMLQDSPMGNKARSLLFLRQSGFQVPEFFVIDPDQLPDESTLMQKVENIGGFPVACRSSSNVEDLDTASFAGLYETYLNIPTLNDLLQKIKLCADAYYGDKVQSYLRQKNINVESQKLFLIVQKMVDVAWSGVTFTLNPLSGNENETLTEYHNGLGEDLVSGRVQPRSCLFNNQTGEIVKNKPHISDKIPTELLSDISESALKIQSLKHFPQDIEWAIGKDQKIYFLQTRNITQFQYRQDVAEHTNSDFRDGGVSARVCTPLMYSLYRESMQESMPRYLKSIKIIPKKTEEQWINFFYGRPYWNLEATKMALAKIPGFSEKDFDRDLGITKDYTQKAPLQTPTNLVTIAKALPVVFALKKAYNKNIQETDEFFEDLPRREAKWKQDLKWGASLEDESFFKLYYDFMVQEYLTVERLYFTTIYNNSNAQTEFKSYLSSLEPDIQASYTDLVIGLGNVTHMSVQKGLDRLVGLLRKENSSLEDPRFQNAFLQFLEENYFHADEELNLLCPRWRERPDTVKVILKNLINTPNAHRSLSEIEQRQEQVLQRNIANLESQIKDKKSFSFWHLSRFHKNLQFARRYLRRREEMREASSKCYYFVRSFHVELGRRLTELHMIKNSDDVFFLDILELLEFARSPFLSEHESEKLRFKIYRRKLLFDGYRDFQAPNEVGASIINSKPNRHSEVVDLLSGTGCSPGVVEGKARIIYDLKNISLIEPGEILVTRFTDPGWTPVFSILSGIVTEVGGVLSHASIISREYGIPAILNVERATQMIKDGQRIRLDGHSGQVTLLS